MTTREARKNLCKLMSLTKATRVHAFGKLRAVIVPTPNPQATENRKPKTGNPAALRRWREEQMHTALSDALKGEQK